MQFDTATTLITICSIVALLGLQCLFFWARDRRSPWLGWFAAAFICGGLGTFLYVVPSTGHEFLLLGVGNADRIMAFAFLWNGSRVFAGRQSEHLTVLLAITLWLALCSVPSFLDNLTLRVAVAALYIALFCGLAAWELWRNRAEALPSQMPAVLTYASYAGIALIRIPLIAFTPFPVGPMSISGPWLAAYALLIFVHATFIVALTLSMTRERREFEQRRQALSDPLTGLLNRRAYTDEFRRIADRRRGRGQHATSMLVLDLDDFKTINDRHGHEAGDLVLQVFAEVARENTRTGDLLYRMGGEEFCFVLPETEPEELRLVAERIRRRFAETRIEIAGETIRATVSIGIASTAQSVFNLDLLLAAGDAAVYRAKGLGRNRTVVADTASLIRPEAIGEAAAA